MSDSVDRRELLEMALRPLGALVTAAGFPQDRAGIEALIERLAEGRPSERKHFAYEDGQALPRYDGEFTTWLSPAGDGALRVRREHPWDFSSVAVALHPDGRLGEFEHRRRARGPGSGRAGGRLPRPVRHRGDRQLSDAAAARGGPRPGGPRRPLRGTAHGSSTSTPST